MALRVHIGADCKRTRTRTRATRAHVHERSQRYAPNDVGTWGHLNI